MLFKIIKKTLLLVVALLPLVAMATNYYVDPSSGGTNSGTFSDPWTSLGSLQSNMSSLAAGDIVSFKRGQTYTGTPIIVYTDGLGVNHYAVVNITKSGTSGNPITFNAYGTGAAPKFTGATAGTTVQAEFYMSNRSYLVFDGLEIYDPVIDTTSTTRTVKSKIERAFEMDNASTHNTIQNCVIRAVGVGANWFGDYNTMTYCYVADLTMIVDTYSATPPANDDDYGANPIVASSSNNTITHNSFIRCWAHSFDYGVDGGAIEFSGNNITNNFIAYNKIDSCCGILETAGTGGSSCQFIYNLMVNNGNAIYFHDTVTNYTFYNNTVIETTGPIDPTGSGFFGGSISSTALDVENNIFQFSNGVKVKASITGISPDYNIYKMSGTSTIGYTAAAHDITTSAALFTNTSPADPVNWDYYPLSTGPQVGAGVNHSLSPDYAGNTVTAPPTIGHLQYMGLISITTGTITPAGYCAGGSVSVPYTTVGAANAGNTFTAQLSNASGSFASPVTLGTLSSTTSGTISGTIPGGTTAGTGYYIRVVSSNPSITGSSYGPITVSTATPATPGLITGPTNACFYFSSPATFSISPVTNATSYIWTLPTGATGTSTTNSIDVTFNSSFVSGTTIGVQAVSFCGTSGTRTKTLSRLNPGSPAAISGPTNVCTYVTYGTTANYSTSSSNSNSYVWTLPTGASGTSSIDNINVTFSPTFVSGTITVKGVNGCANSGTRSLNIAVVGTCKMAPHTSELPSTTILQSEHVIYPNPSNGNFKITLTNQRTSVPVAIQIVNEFGEVVYKSTQQANNGIIAVDLAGKLQTGMYTVSYADDKERMVKKLIIAN